MTLPAEGLPVWEAFCALSLARRSGMGASPLTYVDIDAWCRLYGVRLTPWELDTLRDLDAKTLSLHAEHQARNKPKA